MPSPRDQRTRIPFSVLRAPYSSYLDTPILSQEAKYSVLMLYALTL